MTTEKVEKLKSLVTLVVGFLLVFLITKKVVFVYVAFCISIIALYIPFIAGLLFRGWTGLIHVLGTINSYILLTVIFFIILIPLAFASRLFKKNTLLKADSDSDSYYITREHEYTAEDLKNVW